MAKTLTHWALSGVMLCSAVLFAVPAMAQQLTLLGDTYVDSTAVAHGTAPSLTVGGPRGARLPACKASTNNRSRKVLASEAAPTAGHRHNQTRKPVLAMGFRFSLNCAKSCHPSLRLFYC